MPQRSSHAAVTPGPNVGSHLGAASRRALRGFAVMWTITLGVGLVGCGPSKVSECNRLVEVVNTGVASLDEGMKATSDTSGVAELRSMADAMEKAAVDAEKVELSIAELKDYSKQYQTMAREVARSARDMATAVDAKDNAGMTAAQNAMEKAVKTEDPLVESINKFCGGT